MFSWFFVEIRIVVKIRILVEIRLELFGGVIFCFANFCMELESGRSPAVLFCSVILAVFRCK